MGSFSPLNHLSGSRQRRANFTLFESQSFPESPISLNINRDPWPLATFRGWCLYSPGSWPRLPPCAAQWCPVASAHRLSQITNLTIPGSPFRQCLRCLSVSLLLGYWPGNAGRHLTSVGNAPDPTNHMSLETVHPSGEKRDTGLLFVWLFKIQKSRVLLPLRFFLHGFSSNHLIICNMSILRIVSSLWYWSLSS